MKPIFALILAAGSLAPLSAQAQGQNCGNRALVVDRLESHFGESRQSIGMAANGRVVEVFASHETGTWTITVTLPNGVTCLIASGNTFESLNEPVAPAGIRG
jgi:hypothetical protein